MQVPPRRLLSLEFTPQFFCLCACGALKKSDK